MLLYDSFPLLSIILSGLTSASLFLSIILVILWWNKRETTTIWLAVLGIVIGLFCLTFLTSIDLYKPSDMTINLRWRYIFAMLMLIFSSIFYSYSFPKKFQSIFIFNVIILLATSLFVFVNMDTLSVQEVIHKTLPWGEKIAFIQNPQNKITWIVSLVFQLSILSASIISLITIRTNENSKWLFIALLAPHAYAIAQWTNLAAKIGIPLAPFSNTTFLLIIAIPIIKEILNSHKNLQKLNEKETQITEMAKYVPGVLYSLLIEENGNRKFLFLSDRCQEILGFSASHPDPLLAFSQALSDIDKQRYRDSENECITKLTPWDFQTKFTTNQGIEKWIQGLSYITKHPKGILSNGVILDITERIVLEKEHESLVTDVSLRKEELEALMKTLTHDLRNPLVNIDGFIIETEILLNQEWNEDSKKEAIANIQVLKKNSSKISEIIDLLLKQGRYSRDTLHITPMQTQAIFDEALNSIDTELPIHLSQAKPLPPTLGDQNQLLLVFKKVLENCVNYRKENQPLRIELSHEIKNDFVYLNILDNGMGIDPAKLELIFKPFTQLQSSTSINHKGLGLSVVKLALLRMNGKIWATSEPDKGTCMHIRLPYSMP